MSDNLYVSVDELRKLIESDLPKYVKSVNCVEVNPKAITEYDRLILDRYLTCNVINFLLVEGKNVSEYEGHIIDNKNYVDFNTIENRYIQLANMFKNERNWFKNNYKPAKEKISFYTNGEQKLKYTHKKNGSKKLIIVFQSSWALLAQINATKNKLNELDYDEVFRHEKYQFFNFSKNNKEYDYIYLQDDFNYIYGWFLFNYGKKIDGLIVDFIEQLSNIYDTIDVVGASKGAYGAYHICKTLDVINSIVLIAPIFSLEEFSENINSSSLIDEITSRNIDNYNYMKEIESRKNRVEKVYCVSGEGDYHYDTVIEVAKNNNIYVNVCDEEYDHSFIIINEYKKMFSKYLNIN